MSVSKSTDASDVKIAAALEQERPRLWSFIRRHVRDRVEAEDGGRFRRCPGACCRRTVTVWLTAAVGDPAATCGDRSLCFEKVR